MGKNSRSSKDARREAQERLAEQRAQQQAADRRRSLVIGSIVVLAVVVVAGLVFVQLRNDAAAARDVGTLPANVSTENYGVITGTETSGVPVIDVYEDFQCPACRDFEVAIGPTLEELAESGEATVIYHPMQFLDRNLNNDSSARAANAAGCAADQDAFVPFHRTVFANQPEAEGVGFTDEQLIGFGATAGLDNEEFSTCVEDQTFAKWAKNGVQRQADDKPVTATPSVFVNDVLLENSTFFVTGQGWDADAFVEAFEAASGA